MQKLLTKIYLFIFSLWRPGRIRRFVSACAVSQNDVILDIGGYPYFWLDADIRVKRIDTINLDRRGAVPADFGKFEIRVLQGNACDLPFADREYDIAFSNSVIEHVGTLEDQARFAAEARRVAGRIWVQTPAFVFPIEPHCLAPFLHWFPWSFRKHLLRFTPHGLMTRDYDGFFEMMKGTRILRKSEFASLFPDSEILTEYVLGFLPKSYIAVRLIKT